MTPILYISDGIVSKPSEQLKKVLLVDSISCSVCEERNGAYELELEYPLNGAYYDEIKTGRFIAVQPSDGATNQPFRIFKIHKPLKGIIKVTAQHISYDLKGIPVTPFKANDCASALKGLIDHSLIKHPFTVWTDVTGEGKYIQNKLSNFRARLAGEQGSIISSFSRGMELEFDNTTVKVWQNRGQDNGVSIRYGKNLIDLSQDENVENIYNGVLAYWYKEENHELVSGNIKYIANNKWVAKDNILILDASNDFDNKKPTVEDLDKRAVQYIQRNKVGEPKISIKVSFIQLWQTEEYKDLVSLERVKMCDIVHVYFEKLGIKASAKVVKTDYDVLKERYNSITIGNAKSTLGSEVQATAQNAVNEALKGSVKPIIKSMLDSAVEHATAKISGFSGYITKINNAEGKWSELVISDHSDYKQAHNVWRWTQGGLGFSSNGYQGPYNVAITSDGHINGAMITAGTINANMINIGNRTLTETLSKIENNTTNAVKEIKLYYALFDFGKIPQKDDPAWKTTKPKRPPFLEDLWYMQAYVLQDGTEVRLDPTKNLEKALDFYIAGQERDREETIKKTSELDKKIDSSLKLINENKSLINQTNNSISSIVESKTKILNDKQENIKNKSEELEKEVSKLQAELKITSNAISQRVEQDNFDGFKKQMESMLDINGLHVGESGKGKSNINSDGLVVTDANNEIIAKFTNDDSRVNFLNVREHLSVGSHRFEMFNDDLEITSFSNGEINTTSLDGTAIYWIGDVK